MHSPKISTVSDDLRFSHTSPLFHWVYNELNEELSLVTGNLGQAKQLLLSAEVVQFMIQLHYLA